MEFFSPWTFIPHHAPAVIVECRPGQAQELLISAEAGGLFFIRRITAVLTTNMPCTRKDDRREYEADVFIGADIVRQVVRISKVCHNGHYEDK